MMMESLRNTEAIHERIPDAPRRFNPLFFAHKDRLARLCLGALLCSLVCNGLETAALFALLRQKEQVTVVDDEGNAHAAMAKPFSEARELHQRVAFEATEALLLKNPRDFDEPEMLQSLFARPAMTRATALKTAEARQFDELQIEQKPLISRIDIRQSAPGELRATVSGELSRIGVVNQKPFSDPVRFTLELILRRNQDLLRNRIQPLKVWDFLLNYETPAH
jgi:hypothetical protein